MDTEKRNNTKRRFILISSVLVVASLVFCTISIALLSDSSEAVPAYTKYDRYFAGGTGTADDPWLISNGEQLKNIALTDYHLDSNVRHFLLVTDLDISSENWTPIGDNSNADKIKAFNAAFDGNGHTIKYKALDCAHGGLFAMVSSNGYVKNLNVIVDITATRTAGGICSYDYGLIENCTVTGFIDVERKGGSDIFVGGISGFMRGVYSRVYHCSSDVMMGALGTKTYMGGIVGYAWGGVISSCISGSSLTSTGDGAVLETGTQLNSGGIVAWANDKTSIGDCIFSGSIYSNVGAYISYTMHSGTCIGYVNWSVKCNAENFYGKSNCITEVSHSGEVIKNNISIIASSGSLEKVNVSNYDNLTTCDYSSLNVTNWTFTSGQIPHLKRPVTITTSTGFSGHNGVAEIYKAQFNIVFDNNFPLTTDLYAFKSGKTDTSCTFNYFGATYAMSLSPKDATSIYAKNYEPVYVIGADVDKSDFFVYASYPDGVSVKIPTEDFEIEVPSSEGKQDITITSNGFQCKVTGYFHNDSTYGVLAFPENGEEPIFLTCTKGGNVEIPEVSKDGFGFNGWKNLSDPNKGGNGNPCTYKPDSDVTLYGTWYEPSSSGGGGCIGFIGAVIGTGGIFAIVPFLIKRH